MDVVGISSENGVLRAVRLRRYKGVAEIALIADEELQNLPPGCKVVTGLPSSDLLMRKLPLELKSRFSILKTLPFQAEATLPYPPAETILLPFIGPWKNKQRDVTLFATTKNQLQHHLEKMRALGFDPDQVSCTPSAIVRFARHFYPNEGDLFFLHLESGEGVCGLLLGGKLEQFYAFGIDEKAETASLQLQKEIDRAFTYLQKKAPRSPEKLLLTGRVLTKRPECLAPLLILEPEGTSGSFAPLIGLALDGLNEDAQTVQFRQGEFLSERAEKKRVKLASHYLLACLVLTATAWTAGHKILSNEDAALEKRLVHLAPLKAQASGSLEEKVTGCEEALKKEKMPFPLTLTTPKASDVLAWLSTHPQLTQEIDIKEVHYSLVKHPKLGTSLEPYTAKVSLKFTATSPTVARNFRDALQKGDARMLAKQTIGWNISQNMYEASFELKQGTAR